MNISTMQVGELVFAWRRPHKKLYFTNHLYFCALILKLPLICSTERQADHTYSGIFVVQRHSVFLQTPFLSTWYRGWFNIHIYTFHSIFRVFLHGILSK